MEEKYTVKRNKPTHLDVFNIHLELFSYLTLYGSKA